MTNSNSDKKHTTFSVRGLDKHQEMHQADNQLNTSDGDLKDTSSMARSEREYEPDSNFEDGNA